jgi:hypothetical protein
MIIREFDLMHFLAVGDEKKAADYHLSKRAAF